MKGLTIKISVRQARSMRRTFVCLQPLIDRRAFFRAVRINAHFPQVGVRFRAEARAGHKAYFFSFVSATPFVTSPSGQSVAIPAKRAFNEPSFDQLCTLACLFPGAYFVDEPLCGLCDLEIARPSQNSRLCRYLASSLRTQSCAPRASSVNDKSSAFLSKTFFSGKEPNEHVVASRFASCNCKPPRRPCYSTSAIGRGVVLAR